MLTKQDIINEIKRTAKSNGDVPLGGGRFEKETGIKPYDWGKYWARFSEAQTEAGFDPNTLNAAYDSKLILQKYVELMQELGRFPTSGDLRVKSNSDPDFPSKNTMRKLGNKRETAEKILEFARQRGHEDVIGLCEEVIENYKQAKGSGESSGDYEVGEVYLFKSGRYYKIGKTNDTVRRGNEIRIQLPEKLNLIHSIKTDDPSGIEAYWHKRFESKRKQGEWFDLNSTDIKAFRRWRKIV